MNKKVMNSGNVKEYSVSYYLDGLFVETRCYRCASKSQLFKDILMPWYYEHKEGGENPRFDYHEVVHYKPLSALFLSEEKRKAIAGIYQNVRNTYRTYRECDEYRAGALRKTAWDMHNSLQNEFYMSADICDNTVWHWNDVLDTYDTCGYMLAPKKPTELSGWSQLLMGWYNRQWAVEVLRLIRDFNLDNQNPDHVSVFQSDFARVKSDKELHSCLLKWNDLIFWSPWKLSFYDDAAPQLASLHYEDEVNPDYVSDFDSEEV